VGVGEAHLVAGAGVGPLAAADRAGALGPAGTGKIQPGQLGDPGTPAGSAVGVHGGLPYRLGQIQDRLLDALVAVEPDREPQVAADELIDDGVGGAGGVGADQDRPPTSWPGQASSAIASTRTWSAAVLDPALPGRRIMASADHRPMIPPGSAGSSSASTRQAVGVEQTWPNSSGWSRRRARSPTQSPPSASMTTRSRST
jgi:hypothetical protein